MHFIHSLENLPYISLPIKDFGQSIIGQSSMMSENSAQWFVYTECMPAFLNYM